MFDIFKKIISNLPLSIQQELKRYHYWRQIKVGTFNSDEPEFFLLEELINPGDYVLDIGANVGHYSLKFSKLVGPTGRVFSFEPSPRNFELLSSNLNKLNLDNYTLFNIASSDSWKMAGMEVPKFSTGLNNYYMAKISDNSSSNNTLCASIDSFNFTKPIKLIKIDVEGHELEALNGLIEILKKGHPILIIEGDHEKVNNLLKSLNYNQTRLPNSPNILFK